MKTDRGRMIELALWGIQGLLAAIFLFAGGIKLVMPLDILARLGPLSPQFMRLIGTAEVLGALGLILPALFPIQPVLTSAAGAGLAIIMIGATAIMAASGPIAALVPLVVGLLSASVALGRRFNPGVYRRGASSPRARHVLPADCHV